ncbi:MAG TPA: hypothetical protein VFE30_12870 [Anaeromyxobacteraceae bacterium]|nr:hypothetical protein [Anaeromyxobacteraceae bacterium]
MFAPPMVYRHRLGVAFALALVAGIARAGTPAPLTAADLTGARALSMGGAFRAMTGGNESLYLNPAALAVGKRYSFEALYLNDRTGADSDQQWAGLSVVDGSNSLAAGFAYHRLPAGLTQGNAYHLALATPIGESLYVGATGKYLQLNLPSGARDRELNADVGLFLRVNSFVSIGGAAYNLLASSHREQTPRGMGAGLAIGDERTFHVAADWRGDFDNGQGKSSNAFGAGAEYLLLDFIPLRAGYVKDDTLGGRFWTAGAGVVSAAGTAIDVAYRQSLDDASRRTLMVALKVFLPTM